MRVAVVGAGAMGSIYAAALLEAGHDVAVLDVSESRVREIRADGLVLLRGGAEHVVRVPATTDPAEIGQVDMAVVLVKGYHTRAAMELARPLVGGDTFVLSLQNGWGNGEELARAVGEDRVLVGVSYHSAAATSDGRIAHTNEGVTKIGPFAGTDLGRAERAADALRSGGLACDVTASIRQEAWKKLTLNTAALPTAALTSLRAIMLAEPPMWPLVSGIARETLSVGKALGFTLDDAAEVEHVRDVLVAADQAKASMLQDVERGRRTEIDTINGAVVRLGEEHGIDVPLNRAMVALVHGFERSREARDAGPPAPPGSSR